MQHAAAQWLTCTAFQTVPAEAKAASPKTIGGVVARFDEFLPLMLPGVERRVVEPERRFNARCPRRVESTKTRTKSAVSTDKITVIQIGRYADRSSAFLQIHIFLGGPT
ncbi:hypothetical protein NOK12_11920 [Nocardioides sp. OK12]|nr:hypothetical protein NOK12_11920 [Nocardioides sp. OK12]